MDVLNTLGWALINSGNVNKGLMTWNKAMKIDPNNQTTRENLVKGNLSVGQTLRKQGAYGPALVHFKNILKLMPDQPEVFMEIGNTYAHKGDYKSAIENWEIVLKHDPKNKFALEAIKKARMQQRS